MAGPGFEGRAGSGILEPNPPFAPNFAYVLVLYSMFLLMETCIKGLSRKVRLILPPSTLPLRPDLAVFLWFSFKIPAKVPPSPI